RNLVIHRDIKPGNILIDSAGDPKLLDFGIAKMLDADAVTDQTCTHERLLTPGYASPEQIRGVAQSAATDIYSLGAVLYQLLTGRSPHSFTSGSHEAVEAAICSADPPAPHRVNPEIPRDLESIVTKALRKEPQDRYGSVDDLAGDLCAFLDRRPVQ